MIDLLYTSHNRKAFAAASFAALTANTNWALVNRLYVVDDSSSDGTMEMLAVAVRAVPCASTFTTSNFGGSVAPLTWALDRSDADIIAKIDSDVVVCPGWLQAMTSILNRHRELDALGMEPGFASPFGSKPVASGYKRAPHIGGVGLIRTRVFARRRPAQNNRFFGWTDFQRRYVKAGWIDPDLPVFLLDHLPLEPWLSLTEDYVRRGWQRAWPNLQYPPEQEAYYAWWLRERVAVA